MSKPTESQVMRQDWDERARKNAYHYVATWRSDWTPKEFQESGEQEYLNLVQPVLDENRFASEASSMLEIGCGAGRMTGSFASRFATVYALDISAEMQTLAKQNLAELRNIQWVLGDGTSLLPIPNGSVDFVFSYLVLQHLPTEALAYTYMKEMLRVLKPGGLFLFQYNGAKQPTMNLNGRVAWGVIDMLWGMNLKGLSQATAGWLGFDPATVGKSWRGASLQADRVIETLRTAGGSDIQITAQDTPLAWCRGRKLVKAAR